MLGHNMGAYNNGTTEEYSGDPTKVYYTDRATNQYEHPRAPRFSNVPAMEVVKGAVTETEMQLWQETNEPDAKDVGSKQARR